MKYFLPFILMIAVACNQTGSLEKLDLSKPSNDDDNISYTIGYEIGSNFRADSLNINNEYFMRGIMDGRSGDTSEAGRLMNAEEMHAASEIFRAKLQEKHMAAQQAQMEMMKVEGEKAKGEGEKFLAENKKKSGVITLPSGAQYKVIKEGKGPKAGNAKQVKMHLVAKFIDGKEFDNTYNRNEAATLPVEGLIPGWQEIIPMMPVGSKWEVYLPFNLAYGEQGFQGVIPPYSTLIFEMELLEVIK